ncbi:MAG: nuclear transport factor 2 family protein [bacterium]
MKRIMMAALVFVVFSISPVGHAQKAMGNKAGLEKTVNAFFELVKASNADKIKTYYTADYTFTGPDGKMMNGDERLKMMKEGTVPTVQSYSDVTVRTYGNSGLATGLVTTKNSNGAAQNSRFIQVWVWKGGRWWLAASQVTPIS